MSKTLDYFSLIGTSNAKTKKKVTENEHPNPSSEAIEECAGAKEKSATKRLPKRLVIDAAQIDDTKAATYSDDVNSVNI
jgi:hypothetical protein